MSKIISGIYKIENKTNGKIYIGSSKNIENRWKQHKTLLKVGKHHSRHLQYAWDKYGEDSFSFCILEEVLQPEELFNREQYWMDKLQSYNPENGYNISVVAGACVMNEDYDFREIINAEYEQEHKSKYEIIHMIANLEDEELVYKNIILPIETDAFTNFIIKIYEYMVEIQFKTWEQITLYNSDYNLAIHDLSNLPTKFAIDSIRTSKIEKIKFLDPQSGYTSVFYRKYFKVFKMNRYIEGLKIKVLDEFNFEEVFIYKPDDFDIIEKHRKSLGGYNYQ